MDALATYALRLGDDSLILGQRLGEWCGHAPALEVDLSLTNVALDQVGQATHFLGLAGAIENAGRDADALAFRRDVMDFTNCLLVEQPNGDFAQTIARQFLFSHYQALLFEQMARVKDERFAAIAAKALKEVSYHATLASDWVVRLGDGTEESKARMVAGLDWMWRFADELFVMDDVDAAAIAAGAGVDKSALRAEWDARIDAVLADATLARPASRRPVLGGRAGHHSEHLGHLLSDMQFLQRAYPDATW
ncbi:MAG: phenylacetate-CoA oxygenase subunit PaaC [Hyphomonadaceae bacterium]|nr:phenylacetate-CoA oxygenase subunit PaaC [Hyphomonadaceae bacterium]